MTYMITQYDHNVTIKVNGIECVTEVRNGVQRFQRKPLQNWLADHTDLNKLWMDFHRGDSGIAIEELMQFYMDMGYSVCGFAEIFIDGADRKGIEPVEIDNPLWRKEQ